MTPPQVTPEVLARYHEKMAEVERDHSWAEFHRSAAEVLRALAAPPETPQGDRYDFLKQHWDRLTTHRCVKERPCRILATDSTTWCQPCRDREDMNPATPQTGETQR